MKHLHLPPFFVARGHGVVVVSEVAADQMQYPRAAILVGKDLADHVAYQNPPLRKVSYLTLAQAAPDHGEWSPVSSVDEAIHIANDSELGLKAFLFGKADDCLKLVPRLQVGTVHINCGSGLRPDAPMPGYKASGVGSEWSEDGLREFVVPQHIDLALG